MSLGSLAPLPSDPLPDVSRATQQLDTPFIHEGEPAGRSGVPRVGRNLIERGLQLRRKRANVRGVNHELHILRRSGGGARGTRVPNVGTDASGSLSGRPVTPSAERLLRSGIPRCLRARRLAVTHGDNGA